MDANYNTQNKKRTSKEACKVIFTSPANLEDILCNNKSKLCNNKLV